jgi:hypothetical protein
MEVYMELTVKIRILLLALYEHKYNGKLYELGEILANNGIKVNPKEMEGICEMLSSEGLLKILSIRKTIYGQITVDGVEFLEENNFFGGSSYRPQDKIKPLEWELMHNRIDEMQRSLLKSRLATMIDAGLLALEMEELKALQNVLGRRNWLQILKGKLFELSKGQINISEIDQLLAIIEAGHAAEDTPSDKKAL